MSPYRLVYEKPIICLWNLNIKLIGLLKLSIQSLMMLDDASQLQKLQINELEEIRNDAYDNSRIHKTRIFMTRKY